MLPIEVGGIFISNGVLSEVKSSTTLADIETIPVYRATALSNISSILLAKEGRNAALSELAVDTAVKRACSSLCSSTHPNSVRNKKGWWRPSLGRAPERVQRGRANQKITV